MRVASRHVLWALDEDRTGRLIVGWLWLYGRKQALAYALVAKLWRFLRQRDAAPDDQAALVAHPAFLATEALRDAIDAEIHPEER